MSETDSTLLGPDDPAPFSTLNDTGTAPVLVVCDHASRAFPKCMARLGLDSWVLDRHVAWDIGTDLVGPALAKTLNAPAIIAGYSRLVIDLNRRLDDPTAFIECSDGIDIPGNQRLTSEDKRLRAEALYHTYHNAIAARLTGFFDSGIVPAMISIHSFTPNLNEFQRPWEVGVLWDKDPRIAQPLIAELASRNVCVGDNQPYSGKDPHDYTIDHHAEGSGIPYVSIEIRQDLIEKHQDAKHWTELLAESLKGILANPDLYQKLDD